MPLTLNPNTNTANLKAVDFDPFAGPKLLIAIPTTPSQVELWLSCIIGGDDANRSYNESVSLDLEGQLNQCALVNALEQVVERHEILRSTFSSDGKMLCIHEAFPLELELIDISDLAFSEQQTYVNKVHQADADKAFDLLNGPLFRSYLIKLSEKQHILKLSAHHIVCDGWSFGILLENISKIYNSIVNDEPLILDDVIPYSKYAKELNQYSISEEYKTTEKFWLNQFSGDIPVVDVPTDRPRPSTRTFKSKREDFIVPKELIEKVKKTGATSGTSLVSTLIAAFEAYMYLKTQQNTIVLGIPAAGQNVTGHYELVGHCVNLLPLKSEPKGEQSFSDYLSQRKSQILDAYDHQQFTFGTLMQKLNIARDSSRIPLVPIIFNIDMGMDANVSFSGLTHSLSNNPRSFENFEIFLNITGTEQALTFEWSYNAYLFEPSTIRRMMGEFEGVLNEIVTDPRIRISNLLLKSNHLLAPQLDVDRLKSTCEEFISVAGLIDRVASDQGEKTAVFFKNEKLSYDHLNKKSSQLAHYLLEQGVQKDDIIALCVDRSSEMVIALLGILKSGAAYLPIDPQLPKARIEYMLDDASVKFTLAERLYVTMLGEERQVFILEDILNSLETYPTTSPENVALANDLAYILYTSGSTGKPKGVQIEHHSLTNFLLSVKEKPGITAEDKLLAITTISFDIAATEIFLPLISGASTLLVDSDTAKDGRELFDLVQKSGITIMQATPTTWRMMLAAGWSSPLPIKIICTGEAFPRDLAEKLLKLGQEVWNGYGPTETTIWSSLKQMTKADTSVTIGKPIANTEIYILDEEGNQVPTGTVGEIFIAGEGLARGYVNQPVATNEKFILNPFSDDPQSRMYASGDLGYYLQNGEIVCVGRKDSQVKIRGHRIELGEIEYSLMTQPRIKDAAVITDGSNTENQSLLAYIVPDETDSSGWVSRWDDLYTLGIKSEEDKPLEEQNLDIAIISQYNTEKDIHEHGIEWTNEGLKRIRAIGARKILELGTGGGHLLLQLAPQADRYIATDYSGVAINKLKEKLSLNPEKWQHVSVYQAPADDFSEIPEKELDLVFLHGVVQYFPTLEYVVKVIREATKALKNGGCIHIGDAQTLNAIRMHFATEQLSISADNLKLGEFKKTVQYRVEKEEEISIDPGFFYFLPQIIPTIRAVDVQIRGGNFSNEATKCHYDIWLWVGDGAPEAVQNDANIIANEDVSEAEIEKLLDENRDRVVQVSQIPNRRVAKDVKVANLLNCLEKQTPLAHLKKEVTTFEPNGINPNDLWNLGEKMGYKTHIRWANDGSDGKIEVVFIPSKLGNVIPAAPADIEIKTEADYFPAKKEAVEILKIPEHQIQAWKNALENSLPEYMIPKRIIAINHMPLNANGKIDKKALPIQLVSDTTQFEKRFIAPRNNVEQTIAEIWCELLGHDLISVTSNFFELGGHSLIAVKVMLRLEKDTGIKLPISTLFENSTIEKLASRVNELFPKAGPSISTPKEEKGGIITVPAIQPQIEIWVACMLGGDDANRSYNISFNELLLGNLNYNALETALQDLVRRHQSLRATFSKEGKNMLITPAQKVNLIFEDLQFVSSEEQPSVIEKLVSKNAEIPFDLVNGPLFKVHLIKLETEKHLLMLSFHHIICDGFSSSLLMKELTSLYNDYSQERIPALDQPALFSDYALRMQDEIDSGRRSKQLQYWTNLFTTNNVPELDMPIDYPRPEKRSFNGGRIVLDVCDSIASKVRAISFENNCSSAITLRAAFELLLNKICNQDKLVIGLPFAGQIAQDNSNLIGHCVNLLPVVAEFDSSISFGEHLIARRTAILDAYENHDFTFSELLNNLSIERNASRIPLLPVFLNVQSEPYENSFYKLKNISVPSKKLFETFELAVNIDDLPTGMSIRWDHNSLLFKSETIEHLHHQLEEILFQIAENPHRLLEHISITVKPTDENLLKKIDEWNNTRCDYDQNKTVVELIEEAAIRFPQKIAIAFEDQKLNYSELIAKSYQLSLHIQKEGIKRNDVVGLVVERSIDMIVGLLGIMKAGATYLPIDPQYPKSRVEYMLADSSTKLVVCSNKYNDYFQADAKYLILEGIASKPVCDVERSDNEITGTDIAYILYTSGTTGRPKGVQIEHRSLSNFLLSMQKKPGISDSDILLAVTTISFDIAALEIFLPLISGAQIVVASDENIRDGLALKDLIGNKGITIMQATPMTWSMLLESGWIATSPLKILCGGEPLPKKLVRDLLYGKNEIWNMYGPTETTIWSSVKHIENLDDPISIGTPISNTKFYIRNEKLELVPPGIPGEIYIAGDGLARGYLKRPELTAEKFSHIELNNGNTCRAYKTGDIGYYLENGEVICLGRSDDQIKLNGFRIELGEIEFNLSNHPDVQNAVVVISERERRSLLAYIILKKDRGPKDRDSNQNTNKVQFLSKDLASSLRAYLSEHLPNHMIPSHYLVLNELPLTDNGKINRKTLPLPDWTNFEYPPIPSKPKTDAEKLVASVWSVHLNLESLSINENFFDIGGNSLLAIRIMLSLERQTGTRLPISTLFSSPTIEELAKLITGEKQKVKWESLVPIKPTGSKTPVYLVHGGGFNVLTFEPFSKHMDPEQPIYALQGLGFNGSPKSDFTIEEIAKFYVSEVLENDPIGPYAIGGYCSGGLIAYEMAQQLIKQGKEVSLLAMLDSSYYDADAEILPGMESIKQTLYFLRSTFKHPRQSFWRTRLKLYRYLSIHQDDVSMYGAEITSNYKRAFKNYKVKPIDMKVDLFKASEHFSFIGDPEYYGWKKFALKGVDVHTMTGNHNTFITAPNEKGFASTFQNVLNKAHATNLK